MFHSASSRHEQLAFQKRRQARLLRSSQESIANQPASPSSSSGSADSGYHSPPINEKSQRMSIESDALSTTSSITDSITTHTTFDSNDQAKKTGKKKKRHRKKRYLDQPPREPDYVYSCPRPLAFPFHNDSHFLPVAEADPRDVARIAPPRRVPSMESTRGSSIESNSTYAHSYTSSRNSTASSIGSSTSIRSNMERSSSSISLTSLHSNTVRSLRSLFSQDTNVNKGSISSLTSNRLEAPKLGKLSSLQKLFSRSTLPETSPSIPGTSQPAHSTMLDRSQNIITTPTAMTTEDLTALNTHRNRLSGDKTKTLFFGKRRPTTKPQTTSSTSSTLFHAFWPKPSSKLPSKMTSASASPLPNLQDLPSPPAAPPKPSSWSRTQSPLLPRPKPSISASLKKFFSPSSSRKQTPQQPGLASQDSAESPPVSSSPSTLDTNEPPKTPRKTFFSAFRRSPRVTPQPPPKDDMDKMNTKLDSTTQTENMPPATTAVVRIWKSFKRLVTGKKPSRVGVL
ncbi:hypothetical protein DM01DRAFT_1144918 [Hesseltinella vesiculosa]|uniref:Uncharacterized protein n=1 Tax=Hesseltinella vesiculosa TaxID=101127 RepID=A0A1X2G7B3_9FUNG|nr:hypothetical protein DM01DRAFT_1144918 [Hesseltinella vesiculosa]